MLIVLLRYSVAQSGALKQLKPGAGLFVVQTRLMSNGLDHEQRKYAPLPRICGCWTWSLVLAPRIFYCVFIGSSQSHEHPNPKMCTPHRDLAILWVLDLIPCARAMHFPVIHNDFAQNQNNQPQKHMFFIGICERWSWSVCSRHIFSIMFSKTFWTMPNKQTPKYKLFTRICERWALSLMFALCNYTLTNNQY